MASYTSWRWTGTSFGATMPRRTLSPRISTTVTVMSLLMTMLSFFFLDSTSIGAYPFQSPEAVPAIRVLSTIDTADKPVELHATLAPGTPAILFANQRGDACGGTSGTPRFTSLFDEGELAGQAGSVGLPRAVRGW